MVTDTGLFELFFFLQDFFSTKYLICSLSALKYFLPQRRFAIKGLYFSLILISVQIVKYLSVNSQNIQIVAYIATMLNAEISI